MVISEEARAAIDGEIARYPRKRGALLPALHLVQKELGHLSPEATREVAEIFELRPVEVMEVISFYNMFHARAGGRHHVYVCTNLPCSLRGARGLLKSLEAHLGIEAGETTSDGRITLDHEECLGACGYAPMLRVDETYHEDLDEARAKEILDALE
ncbi:MAG: NAD(P)H-dependent oxidoreductase subunit E [Deltaproteobacteria bacterium]|nr:NAD(P)H-dependent oxidoreductase subunit E [Deltaproteobacteria bacterium]MBW2444560.1 NAD(P)H-dependent oxidoreductase subunit E [Deltaproteobacteria bacterium]